MTPEVESALRRIADGDTPSELESETLDFKEDARSVKESMSVVADAAICFANAQGGCIVIGVVDSNAGLAALVGTELDPLAIKQQIYELSCPPLLVDIAEHLTAGVRLIVVTVPSGVEIHSDTQGRIKHRVGRACLPMTAQHQALRQEERNGVDWSSQSSHLPISDIDPSTVDEARARLRLLGGERRQLAERSDIELLRGLGTVDGQDQLLRAGEVLFCSRSDDQPWIVYQYRPSPGGEASAVERLGGTPATALDKLEELVWARRHTTPLTLANGSQVEVPDFPREAVREAVANALLHREMRIDRPVSVEHSPDVFIVESPGRLVAGVSETNILTHPSKPRNHCLFQAARKLGIAEDTGRGIDRIYRALLRSGRDIPAITQTTDTTRVALMGGAPQTQVVEFTAMLGPSERDDVDVLLALTMLLTHRTVTEATLAPFIQKQPSEAGAVLDRMATDDPGIIETTLDTRSMRKPTYRLRASALRSLGSAVAYHRHAIDDPDSKVIAHINDYGRINNRTIQSLFNINASRASTLLRTLQKRGLLVKTSAQQRGRGVEYGPGPNFPTR